MPDQSSEESSSTVEPEAASQTAARKAKPSVRRRVLRTGGLLAMIYVGVCIGLVLMETRLLFPGAYMKTSILMDPNRFEPDAPSPGEVQTFGYPAVDGSELDGRLLLRESDEVILFLHGNGIHADEMDGWTRRLSDSWGGTVLTAEYRGFQDDGFTPSEESTIEDAVSAIDALSELTGKPVHKIIIYGRSLGGGVASGLVRALQERGDSVQALCLDRTFDSAVNVGAQRFFFLPVRLLMRNHYDSVEALSDFNGALVQIHGTPDRIVPRSNGHALHESIPTRHKQWLELPGMFHNDRLPKSTLDLAGQRLKAMREEAFGIATSTTQPATP
ncbi:alpha/beta hydrolase [Rhodopirellula sp. JC740]|uniref:Alpha/beta hydrolase n=1 Tax=Rhodopirellula halodulae TaxID=2894198 RepID=A0ABS8NMN0_9BACT|nr:alpha/beta hydrolase [Rhodopirellula sp. JC740]MCC9644760.1 alpha/beta hydrolase [Rhodopirellula sp. JC740]